MALRSGRWGGVHVVWLLIVAHGAAIGAAASGEAWSWRRRPGAAESIAAGRTLRQSKAEAALGPESALGPG
jgi:hypothetical protein